MKYQRTFPGSTRIRRPQSKRDVRLISSWRYHLHLCDVISDVISHLCLCDNCLTAPLTSHVQRDSWSWRRCARARYSCTCMCTWACTQWGSFMKRRQNKIYISEFMKMFWTFSQTRTKSATERSWTLQHKLFLININNYCHFPNTQILLNHVF